MLLFRLKRILEICSYFPLKLQVDVLRVRLYCRFLQTFSLASHSTTLNRILFLPAIFFIELYSIHVDLQSIGRCALHVGQHIRENDRDRGIFTSLVCSAVLHSVTSLPPQLPAQEAHCTGLPNFFFLKQAQLETCQFVFVLVVYCVEPITS